MNHGYDAWQEAPKRLKRLTGPWGTFEGALEKKRWCGKEKSYPTT